MTKAYILCSTRHRRGKGYTPIEEKGYNYDDLQQEMRGRTSL